jgi:LmbE family N-acetylglucosaminyl deacetylase
MNIVSVGAHQDDIEVQCLGTLIKYYNQGGHKFTNIVLSNGDKGAQHDPRMPYEEIARVRAGEAAAVAQALGGRYMCQNQSDEYIRDTDEARNWLIDALREAKADLVFTLPPVDYNNDHMITSQITFHAVMLAAVKTIFTAHDPLPVTPSLYYMDSVAGLEWQPTHYVDISGVWKRKCELVRLHKSQMANSLTWGGLDLVKLAQIMGAFRGLQCGVEYAEGFKPALAFPRLHAGCPLP